MHRAVTDNQRKGFPFDWSNLSAQFDSFYQWMLEWEFVKDIDFFEQPTFEQQQSFLEEFYANLFETKESFFDTLNDYYPGWSDDELYTTREIEKTLQAAQSNGVIPIASAPTKGSEEIEMAKQTFSQPLRKTALSTNRKFLKSPTTGTRLASRSWIC